MRNGISLCVLASLWPAVCGAGTFQWLVPGRYKLPNDAPPTENFFHLQPDTIETDSAYCNIRTVVQKGDAYEVTADCSHEGQHGRTTFSIRPVNDFRILVQIKTGSLLPGPWNPTLYEREWYPTRVNVSE